MSLGGKGVMGVPGLGTVLGSELGTGLGTVLGIELGTGAQLDQDQGWGHGWGQYWGQCWGQGWGQFWDSVGNRGTAAPGAVTPMSPCPLCPGCPKSLAHRRDFPNQLCCHFAFCFCNQASIKWLYCSLIRCILT